MAGNRRVVLGERVSEARSIVLSDRCFAFLQPLLARLNQHLDRRLVSTFLGSVMAITAHRDRSHGLLLSELGSYLLSPARAPAGTKRLCNLLRSPRWSSSMIGDFLLEQARLRVQELRQQGEEVMLVWDESVIEKPESIALEGLCPVRSRKAARLKRIKPGYFNPPGGAPIFVPGMEWLQGIILGRSGSPTLAWFRWWSHRGSLASERRVQEQQLLAETAEWWGAEVLHVWDRGFAGSPWLKLALQHSLRFVLRWPKGFKLVDENGQLRKAWQIARGRRSWDHRLLWDARRRCQRKTGVVAFPVHDPLDQQLLWLVVSRPGKGRAPWYLLTSEPVHSAEQAWRIVLAYARRWRVEECIRHGKCEFAFESPRLHRWEERLKLLLMATLAYAFLLSLLAPPLEELTRWLLRYWCHRTGKRLQRCLIPLYRLRMALARLWLTHPPLAVGK
jgi:hypothetical protein